MTTERGYYKITVQDGKLVFDRGGVTVRYTLKFIQKKILEFETELEKWRDYETRLLISDH